MGVSLWVVFRKINKMMCSGDTEWTEKLQPAVLAANTQTKLSTGYTPFYLMFGREFDSSKLPNIVTPPTNPSLNAQPIIESDTELSPPNSTPMDIDDVVDPYEIPNKDNEWEETVVVSLKADMTISVSVKLIFRSACRYLSAYADFVPIFSCFWSMCRYLTDTRQMGLNMTKILEFNIRHFLSKFLKKFVEYLWDFVDFVKNKPRNH